MWTLWLVTFGSVIGNGGATPVVTAMSVFANEAECDQAISQQWADMTALYGKKNTPSPGLFICVPGKKP